MLENMDKMDYADLEAEIIDIKPPPPARPNRSIKWIILAIVLIAFVAASSVGIYIESLWFGSLGFESRYWYVLGLGWALFFIFALLTIAIVRGGFYLLERLFGEDIRRPIRMMVNNQPVNFEFSRFLRPLAWGVAIVFGISFGLGLSNDWQMWMLYMHQPPTPSVDPIFGNPLGFYLFSLPVYSQIASWLTGLAVVMLAAAIGHAILATIPEQASVKSAKVARMEGISKTSFTAVSAAMGILFIIAAWRTLLSRYGYLWTDHVPFSGVTYTEDNYLIPALAIVAGSLIISGAILFFNAFIKKGGRLIAVAVGLPVIVYVIAGMLVPAYVQSFIVKPNELGRETPYIEHNIAGTRAGFNLENVELREYPADISPAALDLAANRDTLKNIRLWDWQALQDTLRQVQEIRTYYDFPDVDVDRYRINGEMRQVMIAPRELDINKLPEQSRNWINERLVYTHGYGVTMNTVNEFTSEGRPRFLISNMPMEFTSDVTVTRPEIYFGERTVTDVYVKTRQPEFDYPQGDEINYTSYEGDGGFPIGSGIRRLCIAWATGDMAKLPFSDDVTSESRVMMHRKISDRIARIAPFLFFDDDPYMIINSDGKLFWMVDAYTRSNRYPYSRSYNVAGRSVNYLRNSVKVTIDAYTGAVSYYVFDDVDPIISAYRGAFPELFKSADEMPAGLREHVRYPEIMIRAQGDVFGLYHTTNAKMFFGREDVWSVARDAAAGETGTSQSQTLDPYQVLMPLPGEDLETEFAQILPFTPGNRNNMIAWMAGRSDGDAYGQLLVYQFPPSRVIDGPLQIEARIDQDAQIAGQITLWNQQGSKVKRGNLIIMPIGTGLLFVEPIYLQALRSPMPELRLVVLATQERLTFASDFETALNQLIGQPQKASEPAAVSPPSDGSQPPAAPVVPETAELIKRAGQTFTEYQRLTSEGKLGEAGQKLDELKRLLDQLQIQKP